MTPNLPDPLRQRLGQVAVTIVLGRHLTAMEDGIALASDLLIADIDPPGVIATAILAPGTTWRDGHDALLHMLSDLGFPELIAAQQDQRWTLLLRTFGHWGLPVHEFLGPFLVQLPNVVEQTALDRQLLTLFEGVPASAVT